MEYNDTVLLIWDLEQMATAEKGTVLLWRHYPTPDYPWSVPQMIEDDYQSLRSRFTQWVYETGTAVVNGRSVAETMVIDEGFSYWWMTEFAEMQHYGKSPQIFDAVRLIAFEQWIDQRFAPKEIRFVTDRNATVLTVLSNWCEKRNIRFIAEYTGEPGAYDSVTSAGRKFSRIPNWVRAGWALLSYCTSRVPGNTASTVNGDVMVFDYLIDAEKAYSKEYRSNYWTRLTDVLEESGCHTSWIQYLTGKDDWQKAVRHVKEYNRHARNTSHHILNRRLQPRQVLRVLKNYFSLALAYRRLKKEKKMFLLTASDLDFNPLFGEAFKRSMIGSYAMSNLILLESCNDLLSNIPTQQLGLYLQENMGWENALLWAWKKYGHGTIIGVPHVTVRRWDLRYFIAPASFEQSFPRPKPDRVALNSETAMADYRCNGYPVEQLVGVEALRYLYLTELPPAGTPAEASEGPGVLVLGDYLPHHTRQQLQWLSDATAAFPNNIRFIFKPHPMCDVSSDAYVHAHFHITETAEGFNTLVQRCVMAFATNVTSAIVDAYCGGLSAVAMLDADAFNMSPLAEKSDVIFVRNSDELLRVLQHANTAGLRTPRGFFYLDPSLRRWKQLIAATIKHS